MYIAKNIAEIVKLKSCNETLTKELKDFIENQPEILRKKLMEWEIISKDTNASFEPLMGFVKSKPNRSCYIIFDVKGGHLKKWQIYLESNEKSKHHVRESVQKVARIIDACNFIIPSDINSKRIEIWRTELRNKGKSCKYLNSQLAAFKSFISWMYSQDYISGNPLKNIKPLSEHKDKKYPRRALTENEVNLLITKTINAEKRCGVTGFERSLIYRLALNTGLRFKEIYTLKRRDFIFSDISYVSISSSNTKNQKPDECPFCPELAKDLKRYFEDNPAMPQTKAFSKLWKDSGSELLLLDLKLAEIEIVNDEGKIDFHSLRHTFVTMAALAGISPQELQKMMRHSDINLTMKYYVHIGISDKAKAVDKLPPIKIIKQEQVKTGTMDVPESHSEFLRSNPTEIHRNSSKSNFMGFLRKENIESITNCKSNNLQQVEATRPTGFGPVTYGLEIRCSIQLSYGRNTLFYNTLQEFVV
jgi:integrase